MEKSIQIAARLVTVGVLVRRMVDVEQLLPENCVLRPKRLGGFSHRTHAIGEFHGILGELVQLGLRCGSGQITGGLAQETDRKNGAARERQAAVHILCTSFRL